ncbi:hypothetical protein H6F61_07240 [Cyanobacteria bacterium FACHB-472]|nr:hypothetical protein [Cyanobacteria bacterium FACHB-472]
MITLNEWDSDYFNRSSCADILCNYIDLEREEDILKYSIQLLQTDDIVAFGTVADVFLDPMPDRRWGKMNPYWSLKQLLRSKAREILLRNSTTEVEDREISEILTQAHYMALRVLCFVGYEEEDLEIAWQILSNNSSIPKLIYRADDVILYTLRYTENISEALNNKLIEYYSERFLEEQNSNHLHILNSLGGDQVAEVLERVFRVPEEERTGIRSSILNEALYSPHINISNRFRPIGQEYCNLYTQMYDAGEIKNFPLSEFKFKSLKQILSVLDELESVITRLKAEEVSIEERIQIVDNWLTEEVFDLLSTKLHNRDFFNQLSNQIAAHIIEHLLDFNKKNYAGILKLMSIADKLSIYDKDSFSKVFIKGNQMLPLARAFNEENQLYPMD